MSQFAISNFSILTLSLKKKKRNCNKSYEKGTRKRCYSPLCIALDLAMQFNAYPLFSLSLAFHYHIMSDWRSECPTPGFVRVMRHCTHLLRLRSLTYPADNAGYPLEYNPSPGRHRVQNVLLPGTSSLSCFSASRLRWVGPVTDSLRPRLGNYLNEAAFLQNAILVYKLT